jgi:hypothetical protein
MKLPVLFAMLTALFWGLYGPAVGQSRGALHSPFKPYLWIGVAYLVWGIGGGLVGMLKNGDNFSFDTTGTVWGFIGGSLGAFGALALTLAMFNGGKPHLVMPIVFGGAVTVSALTGVIMARGQVQTSPWLWVGIVGMGVCVVLVAANTPHAAPHKPGAATPSSESAAPSTTELPPRA